jgi:hypothetical protein
MRNHRTTAAIVAALGMAAAGVAAAAPASAHGHGGTGDQWRSSLSTTSETLADGLLSPLRAAVARDGTTYVTQNFLGQLMRVRPGSDPEVVYTDPEGREVGGVSVSGHRVYFTVTASDPTTHENSGSWLMRLDHDGSAHEVADLNAAEQASNPDQFVTYGFRDADEIDPACAAQWPAEAGPLTYKGAKDSHPYATYQVGHGWAYVADAGANAVLLVSPRGRVHTVAVLPHIAYKITAEGAAAAEIPACFVGETYWFEAVPTDVERARSGALYVSSLPGGPEGPALGARGSIFRVNPWHGDSRQVARGLLGPTGLAAAPDGSVYVAQLFGDEISRVTFRDGHGHHRNGQGHVSTFASVTGPAEVEWGGDGLYATTDALSGTDGTSAPAGKLVRYPLRHHHH